ncbi:MAG: electron transport complex subunit RsxC, partial [Terriglobia bacterium]
MAGRTFKGGIHPPYNKELTAHKAIEAGPDPAEIVIPLSQHIGAPCEPLVAKGDEVKAGQKVGEARGFISAPVHSSVAGKVRAVEFRPHSSGSPALSVVIRAAATEATEAVKVERTGDTVEALREAAREAGLVGLGGAAFPTHVKLTPPEGKTVDTVLINGCECEPYLTCDHRQMLEQAEQMLDGLELISKMVGAKTGYIGIEDNKKDAIKHLKQLTKGMSNVTVVRLATKYPQGFEKKLIEAVLGRVVPLGGLPSDIGVVVQNSGTAIALSEAVRDGKPLIERVVTVTGRGVAEPKNLRVKIGTPAQALVDFCGGAEGETGKIVFGGPMTGAVQTGLEAPVVKGTSGILL